MFKELKLVPKIVFSKGAFAQLPIVLETRRQHSDYNVFIIDHYFKDKALPTHHTDNDFLFFYDSTDEPYTHVIDGYIDIIKAEKDHLPGAVVGIGGGCAMDVAKAVSVMLNNPGKTDEYQGWDLVKNPAVYKIGIPTISGTGSEVSRTTVMTGPKKKQGINSDHSLFDYIILDPEFLRTVDKDQYFFTGMDCYIHSVESITGTFLNEFSKAFASKALEMCEDVFLGDGSDADLMVASLMGGCAIVYSEVGVCHALSYGLSYAFGYHHGIANCIVFKHLEEFYPEHFPKFQKMLVHNDIQLPKNIMNEIDEETLEKMIDVTLLMEKPLQNALGPDWRTIFTRSKIRDLYIKILTQ